MKIELKEIPILDKLFSTGGWSTKKFAGVLLIVSATLMGFLALLIASIVISEAIVLISVFLTAGLTAFGVDAYNKTQKKC